MRRPASRVPLLLPALLLAGCGAAAPEALVSVRDSAGIAFVEHPAGAAADRLGAERVEGTFGLGGDTLTLYRVEGGAFWTPDEIAVADAGNYRIVRWSNDGAFRGVVGGEGQGPGEFQNIAWLQADEGGATLYDARARRLTRFDRSWTLEGSWTFVPDRPPVPTDDAIATFGAALGVAEGRDIVAYDAAFADPVGEPGLMPLRAEVGVWDTTSTQVDSVGGFDLIEWWEREPDERPRVGNYLGGGRIHWSARDSVLAIAAMRAHRIDVLVKGRRRLVILEARPSLPFVPDSIPDAYDAAADSLPAYAHTTVDAEARVWVKRSAESDAATAEWRAFGLDGTARADLTLPADATILDATEHRLLLLRRTDLDEEYVEVRALEAAYPGSGADRDP